MHAFTHVMFALFTNEEHEPHYNAEMLPITYCEIPLGRLQLLEHWYIPAFIEKMLLGQPPKQILLSSISINGAVMGQHKLFETVTKHDDCETHKNEEALIYY